MGTITKKGTLAVDGLRSYFDTGDFPTSAQFDDLITTLVVEGGLSADPGFPLAGAMELGMASRATETDSWAFGSGALASGSIAAQFGSGTNSEPNSLQIGAGIRLLSQAPVTPKNGDVYLAGGKIYGISNGVKVELTSGGLDGAFQVYNTNNIYQSPAIIDAAHTGCIAMGTAATCSGAETIVIGTDVTTIGFGGGMALGSACSTGNFGGLAVGTHSTVGGAGSFSMGSTVSNKTDGNLAVGKLVRSTTNCLTVGDDVQNTLAQGVALGTNCSNVGGWGVFLAGIDNTSLHKQGGLVLGEGNIIPNFATAENPICAVGYDNTARGAACMAIGSGNRQLAGSSANGQAVGLNCTTTQQFASSFAIGDTCTASGRNGSFARGSLCTASGSESSFAEGARVTSMGRSGVWGFGTSVEARGSRGCWAHGQNCTVTGQAGAFAIGFGATSEADSAGIFFEGFNDEVNTMMIGGSAPVRLAGNGVPGTPANGDFWVAGGYAYVRSNGVSVKIT